ncbi:hypothetical protein PG22506_0644 [Bifidobacterium pseudolongum subsp. globosum]|uniref:Uncharacterized protein n=1 Tax=Bifidobacterium pseudolongum subsp. globosum TaxID=1690 RepID=A0A2N3QY97_9BIFI|nr:hypothetical protein CQR56_0432 [Bifidobacterium pseudolongum subsp. globosum]PKV03365.1 hypothetical protein CQR53_0906 [Bifidobacterium pseudolongum subsp. globosum]RYP95532.1 hypothetical protein PG102015_0681 [Bifidobacterium pseudolongum subsp. globosum]RYP97039.1 hypothetical protein PG112206_0656 [Bifidobacterium pseudolongum subsp. globosum]RYP97457.1 hypothetical protein PG102017_0613 [Bifidobacterium pseudolongum subsp. globosum]
MRQRIRGLFPYGEKCVAQPASPFHSGRQLI